MDPTVFPSSGLLRSRFPNLSLSLYPHIRRLVCLLVFLRASRGLVLFSRSLSHPPSSSMGYASLCGDAEARP